MKQKPAPRSLLEAAFDELVGAAVLLDPELRIQAATAGSKVLFGEVPLGGSAVAFLCAGRRQQPLAEAMARGQAVSAWISVPGTRGHSTQTVRAAARPLREGTTVRGWIVSFSAGIHGDDDVANFHGMWTRDPRMKQVFAIVAKVGLDDATVLVRGETGAGKELIAHALHACSPRATRPFVAINCAALPGALLESELFGHARGAFTGAVKDTPGHMQRADGGTLFLDEVAELPLELQAKLLRVLETRTVIPVGARTPVPVDVRIVSATHRPLRDEVAAGRFRADLMYRLRVIPIRLPPLRERVGDVALLATRLLDEMNQKRRRKVDVISPEAMTLLERYDWPGNVRELRNVLEYAYAIGDGVVLRVDDLPPEVMTGGPSAQVSLGSGTGGMVPGVAAGDDERTRIRAALARAGGHKGRAAKLLGMSRVTLWRRLAELDA